ncbi:MAG: hypothetical protein F9K38_09505 [Pseudorhodoplanes sp.]|nr:MAG: hypothetical protein F9K38_09505 [Pseudorhodoplanes sp.]
MPFRAMPCACKDSLSSFFWRVFSLRRPSPRRPTISAPSPTPCARPSAPTSPAPSSPTPIRRCGAT